MKQGTLGANVGFWTPVEHRIKNLHSLCTSSILAKIHQFTSNNIWHVTIYGQFFENYNSLLPLPQRAIPMN
ncbi:hypothetical protein PR202_ga07442 [Eleusine coracana subsp. coracana]|uniref:Uncharacterized protein n=1 Tax=Eleusine coracana subsp. coracana TaxID=191504 RepID=A0AAV5BZ98_ELECO|nr:hypothetical protein PR202_ga07442 [Eleusine coracana subsp. coracana]